MYRRFAEMCEDFSVGIDVHVILAGKTAMLGNYRWGITQARESRLIVSFIYISVLVQICLWLKWWD